MSRYYCKNCGSEAIKGDNARRSDAFVVYCPMCEDENGNEVKMTVLPDYETPEQYEKRMGKKWNGAVFTKCIIKSCNKHICHNKKWRGHIYGQHICNPPPCRDGQLVCFCAQSPEPPPDDWKPEEGV